MFLMQVQQPGRISRGTQYSFQGAQESGQTRRLGIPEAVSVLGLRLFQSTVPAPELASLVAGTSDWERVLGPTLHDKPSLRIELDEK